MTTTTADSPATSTPEYRFKLEGKDCHAALLWRVDGQEQQQLFRKAAISTQSLKGFLPGDFPGSDGMTVVIFRDVDGSLEQIVTAPATIHNYRSGETEEGNWLNLRFETPIGDEELGLLSSLGALNRREYAREPVQYPARGRWQLAPTKFDVSILDVSYGGMRLSTAGEVDANVGDLLLLDIDDANRNIPMELRWKRPVENGTEVGFQFVNQSAFTKIQHIFGVARAETGPDAIVPKDWTQNPIVLLTVAALVLAAGAWLFVF